MHDDAYGVVIASVIRRYVNVDRRNEILQIH